MLKKSVLLNVLLALLIMPASGTGLAGTKRPTKILFVDYTDAVGHKPSLQLQSDPYFGKEGIKCTVTVAVESGKMTAVLELNKCDLETAEQLRGMVLDIHYTVDGSSRAEYYKMEEGLSAEELETFFQGGMLYRLQTIGSYNRQPRLFVNRDGIAIHAVGSQQRTKMNPENITAGENGPMEIAIPIENPHGKPVVLERFHVRQLFLPFKAGGQKLDRKCHVEYVTSKSAPTELVFSIDLKRCFPPLKDPLDLAEMRLSYEYSITGEEEQPSRSFELPPEYVTAYYERFRMLFGGGKKLLVRSLEVVDISAKEATGTHINWKIPEQHASGPSAASQHTKHESILEKDPNGEH